MGIKPEYRLSCDYKGCSEFCRLQHLEPEYWQIIKHSSDNFRDWTVYCPHHAKLMEKKEWDAKVDEIGQGTDSEE